MCSLCFPAIVPGAGNRLSTSRSASTDPVIYMQDASDDVAATSSDSERLSFRLILFPAFTAAASNATTWNVTL